MPRCDACGREIDMPYKCSYCDSTHCERHRLPENHQCPGAQQAAARARERRRTGHPGVEVKGGGWTDTQRQRSGPTRTEGFASGSLGAFEGKVTTYLLIAIGVFWVVENIVLWTQGEELFNLLFVLDRNWLAKPWTLVTSVVSHAPLPSLGHILFNGIVLFFFGPLLEKRIGSRRFLYLVLVGGALAGLAQIGFLELFPGLVESNGSDSTRGVLGISGGLMAVMGVLTFLGPRLKVLIFFIIPAPLWALTLGIAVVSALGLFAPGSVAHMAHLAGLLLGLVVGKVLRDQGYAFPGRTGKLQGGMRTGW